MTRDEVRDEVIKALEVHFKPIPCEYCPYRDVKDCEIKLRDNTIALLKDGEEETEKEAETMTRDVVIKALECITDTTGKPKRCEECVYNEGIHSGLYTCMPIRVVLDALALLKDGDMVRVVRCAECEHWEPNNAEEGDYSGRCRNRGACQNQQTDGTWFCEDGVRMEVDA